MFLNSLSAIISFALNRVDEFGWQSEPAQQTYFLDFHFPIAHSRVLLLFDIYHLIFLY